MNNTQIEIVTAVYDENNNFAPGTIVKRTTTFSPVQPDPNVATFSKGSLLQQITDVDNTITAYQTRKAELVAQVAQIDALNPNNLP